MEEGDGGGLCEMVSQKGKKEKILQGHQRVMFRFLRSFYEKVECRHFWQSVFAFWLGVHPTVRGRKMPFIKTFGQSG